MTTAGKFAKWLGVPVLLLLAGRFVVGPLLLPKMPDNIQQETGELIAKAEKKIGSITHVAPVDTSTTAPALAAGHMEEKTQTPPANGVSRTRSEPSSSQDTSAEDQKGGPEVEVSVRSERPRNTTRVRRAHHRSTEAKKPKPKPPTDTNDPGSFGG